MKVGDLVELSAYGKKLKLNEEQRGRIGLIVRTDEHVRLGQSDATAISVTWSGDVTPALNIRKDLKHVR